MAGTMYSGRNWTQSYGWGRIVSGIVAIVGLWQIVAPFVLDFAGEQSAQTNAIVSGALLTLFGGLAFFGAGYWGRNVVSVFDGLASLTGFWLLISPWVLHYQSIVPAFWSAIVVGVIAFIGAGFAASMQRGAIHSST